MLSSRPAGSGSFTAPTARVSRRWRTGLLSVERLEDRTLLDAAGTLVDWQLAGDRPFTTTEVVASLRSVQPLADLTTAARSPALTSALDLANSQVLFGRPGNWTVQVGLGATRDPREAIRQLQALPFVNWAAPNFIYNRAADPREFTPDDPRYSQQYHHPRMQNDLAWDVAGFGSTRIVVAVTDDGVDLNHQDLYANIWVNQSEIPATRMVNLTDLDGDGLITFHDLNDPVNQGEFRANDINSDGRIDARDLLAPMQMSGGKDLGGGGWANLLDDGENGYVDDLVGWDTASNDNDPNPLSGSSHGTHVAGITAASTNNGVGVAGTAGGVTIMPIRFYGSGQWTSTVVARSYAYAADNGARIMTTSYNVDGFATDPTFIAGLQYMYDLGVLHFNSGGNGSAADSARQRLDHTLYVCSTNVTDAKSSFSNWGYGMDLCAPGENILSTLPNNAYGNNSGTSMASPNAAGVAALLWSIVPEWTREEVVAQMLSTCDNIDAQNPAFAGRLGCGRVNSFRTMTELIAPPTFRRINGLPAEGGSTSGQVRTFQVDLAGVFKGDTIQDTANWEVREAGADGAFDTDDDVLVAMTYGTTLGTPYMVGTNRLYFTLASALSPGSYRFRAISGGLTDPFWQALDGDGDGIGGDHFNRHFTVLGTGPGPGSGFSGGDMIAGLLGTPAPRETAFTPAADLGVLPVPNLPMSVETGPETRMGPLAAAHSPPAAAESVPFARWDAAVAEWSNLLDLS